MTDTNPVNITATILRVENAIHFAEKQSRRQRHGKRYNYGTYLTRTADRAERERVTGNSEKGTPL